MQKTTRSNHCVRLGCDQTGDVLVMESEASAAAPSVTDLSTSLSVVLDQLQTALAKLGGADAPSQQYGDPAAGRALALIAAGVEAPDEVHMETRALHEHLQRLFSLFSAAGNSGTTAPNGSSARMTALGFRKLVRAAQLTSERCTDVDVDLIFQQVVRTRGARMSVGDMMVGLSMVAKRLYPQERTQSAAFHRLLSEQLLPWMLQCAARHACACPGPPPPLPRHMWPGALLRRPGLARVTYGAPEGGATVWLTVPSESVTRSSRIGPMAPPPQPHNEPSAHEAAACPFSRCTQAAACSRVGGAAQCSAA